MVYTTVDRGEERRYCGRSCCCCFCIRRPPFLRGNTRGEIKGFDVLLCLHFRCPIFRYGVVLVASNIKGSSFEEATVDFKSLNEVNSPEAFVAERVKRSEPEQGTMEQQGTMDQPGSMEQARTMESKGQAPKEESKIAVNVICTRSTKPVISVEMRIQT